MWKISVLLTAVLFALPCFASANADMNKVKKANSHCVGVDSEDSKIARDAVKKCDNKDVLTAVLYYHEDFGARFYAAKKISDKEILKKAAKIAKSAKLEGKQKKIRDRFLQLIDIKLGKKTSEKPKKKDEKSFSIKAIVQMKSIGELADIFHKHPSFKAKYYAVKRAYEVLSYIPHADGYSANYSNSKIKSLSKFRGIVSKSIPKIEAMPADTKGQKSYKKKLLAELRKMEKQINPKPGEEVYIDKQAFARHVNALRKKNGLEPIKRYDKRLHAAALKWAKYHYAKKLDKLHHDHGGSTPGKRVAAKGYNYHECGENLDRPIIPNARTIFVDWRESPLHKDNLLEPNYREMGLTCVYAPLPENLGLADYVCVQLLADADH